MGGNNMLLKNRDDLVTGLSNSIRLQPNRDLASLYVGYLCPHPQYSLIFIGNLKYISL